MRVLYFAGWAGGLAILFRWLAWYSTRWDSNNSSGPMGSAWWPWGGVTKDSSVSAYRRRTREIQLENEADVERMRAAQTALPVDASVPVAAVEVRMEQKA